MLFLLMMMMLLLAMWVEMPMIVGSFVLCPSSRRWVWRLSEEGGGAWRWREGASDGDEPWRGGAPLVSCSDVRFHFPFL